MNNVIKEKVIDEILKLLDKTVENIIEGERPDDYLNYIVKIKDGLKDFNLIDLIVIKEYIKDSLDTIEAVEKEAVKDVEPVVADEFTEDLKNSVDADLPKTNVKEPEKDEEKEAEDVKEESQEDAEVNPEEVSEKEKVVDTVDEVIEKGNHLIAAIENSVDTVPDLNTITELIDIKLEIQDKIDELQVLKNDPEAQEKLEIEVKILKDKLNKFEERAMELINASVEETPETAVNSDVEPIVSDEKVEDIDEVDEEVEDVEEPAEPVEDEFDEELDEEINLLAKLADIKEDVEEVIEKIDDIKEEITAEPVEDVDDAEEPVEDVEELEEDFSEDIDNLSEFNKISKEVAVDMDEEPMEMEEVEEEPFEEEDVEEEDEEEDKEKEEE